MNAAERMNSKIRDAQKQKIPYMLVIGDNGTGRRAKLPCVCGTVKIPVR